MPSDFAHASSFDISSGSSRIILRHESSALRDALRSFAVSGLRPAPGRAPPRVCFVWSSIRSPLNVACECKQAVIVDGNSVL